jgi:hypothetical protein
MSAHYLFITRPGVIVKRYHPQCIALFVSCNARIRKTMREPGRPMRELGRPMREPGIQSAHEFFAFFKTTLGSSLGLIASKVALEAQQKN